MQYILVFVLLILHFAAKGVAWLICLFYFRLWLCNWGSGKKRIKQTMIIACFVVITPLVIAGWQDSFDDAYFAQGGSSLICDVLIVAGGGGGGTVIGGGGGGGGVIYLTNYEVSDSKTVTVGEGGKGHPTYGMGHTQTCGTNSVFGTNTAYGGGYGGCNTRNGGNGGSGGGGDREGHTPGTGIAGQGNDGGAALNTAPGFPGGGGGGAGAVGGTPPDGVTGAIGGAGLQFSQFASVGGSPPGWFSGGGGGASYQQGVGAGGAGGGGAGSLSRGVNGTPNTGGGGGASDREGDATAGDGGSGIVIVRYTSDHALATGGTITTNAPYIIHSFTNVGTSTFTPL